MNKRILLGFFAAVIVIASGSVATASEKVDEKLPGTRGYVQDLSVSTLSNPVVNLFQVDDGTGSPFLIEADGPILFEGYSLVLYSQPGDSNCSGSIGIWAVNLGQEFVAEPVHILQSFGADTEQVNVTFPRPILLTPGVTFDDVGAIFNIQARVSARGGSERCTLRAYAYVQPAG